MRHVYRLLIRSHPKAFRERFGSEMLCIFEEAGQTEGPVRLIVDGVLSLLRQWIVTSRATPSALRVAEELPISRLLLGGVISLWLFVILLARGEPHLSTLVRGTLPW